MPDVLLLTVEGLHVPAIPLLDVGDKRGAVSPTQRGGIALKTGVIRSVTVMVRVEVAATQGPAPSGSFVVKVNVTVPLKLAAGVYVVEDMPALFC